MVTTDDEMAYGALDALQSRGIQVPDGVPVVGFDDQAESRFTAPPLTTVRQVRRKVGWCAVEMALKMLSGQPVSEHVVVPTELIVRQSCGCQPPEVVRAAIGECNRSFGEGVRTVLSTHREEILAELEQANEQALAREPLAHALNAFIDEISGQATGGFLPALDRSLQQVLAQGEDAMVWQGVISSLRQQAIPCLTDNAARARAEDLCQQARVLVGEATQREGGRKELRMVQRAETLLELSRSLAAALTIEELSDHLSQGLPLLGIERCYLALYEDPQRPAEWSRLVLARDEQGRLPLEQGGRRFASPQLLPTDIWPAEGTCQLIVAPLYLRERQLGFALFDAVHHDGSVYEALRGQISSALEVVLLSMRNAALYEEALQARAAAEEADRLKSRFLAMVSHELRTPLSLIVGTIEMMLRSENRMPLSEPYRQDARNIHVSAQHLSWLIGDVLDLASSQAGELRLTCKSLDLREVLDEAVLLSELIVQGKGLAWRTVIPQELPFIWGDRTRLRQVVLNLVSNAAKFTERGEVALNVEVGAQNVTLSVTDTGMGIPVDEQGTVFDEFRRSERAASARTWGYGAGVGDHPSAGRDAWGPDWRPFSRRRRRRLDVLLHAANVEGATGIA